MEQDLGKIIYNTLDEILFSTSNINTQSVGSTIELSKQYTDYDYLFIQYESGAGGNFPTQLINVPSMITKRICMTSFNLPDSNPSGGYFYEHVVEIGSNNKTITIHHKNGCKLFDKNENLPVNDFGIRYIRGIKINN